ncbi:MAG TPA: outer membrane lipoprotein LolB [Noviherbaspirillum sp.]|uniref:outer membrane lipoprotein LolB n=1 Tax=Noviherbaspirillum sp. TaxID=1926288 RepID=UPI002D2668E1|nr:outer membrane lipoprotein LolB [Noviherbaspirillum sp.]HYD93760.1 outer membrane lipoprotein LolB [Noviherbaspirillum sp.]
MRAIKAIAVALPLALAGCAGMPPPVAQPAQATAARPFHDSIDLGGRLSVRYQGERQEEALHGSFAWRQTPLRTTVTLLSPLGQTVAVIDVSPQGATLTQAGQPARSAPDVDSLTAGTLGWPLPVAGMREWLQGFALDAAGRRFVASPAAAEVVTRDGWHIRYANWLDENGAAADNRARRVDLARRTEQAGDVSIRIVIDSWQPH